MKSLVGSWFLLGLVGTLPAETPKPESKIQVLVLNYAGVSPETLAQAEREAARIYSRTGIETEWLDCPLAPDQAAQYPACQLPLSPTRLALRVLARSAAERYGLSQATLGSALLPEDGDFGVIAQVCAHCCAELVQGSEKLHAAILGHVMAHELGHLLLGIGSHGATGLMHVPWDKKALESIAQGSLLFTSRETETLRRNAATRLSASTLAQAAAK